MIDLCQKNLTTGQIYNEQLFSLLQYWIWIRLMQLSVSLNCLECPSISCHLCMLTVVA